MRRKPPDFHCEPQQKARRSCRRAFLLAGFVVEYGGAKPQGDDMSEGTVAFNRQACPDCHGTGELRIESENINEDF
jgi:hypothetical protein